MNSYSLKKIISGYSPDQVSLTEQLDKIEKQYEQFFKSDCTKLRNSIPPQEIWRLFIDGDRQHQGWTGFEKTEPGYLHAMLLAFQKIFEPITDLNQLIFTLHYLATNGVKNLNSDTESKSTYRSNGAYSNFNNQTSTKKGIEELIKYINSYSFEIEDYPILKIYKYTEMFSSIIIAAPNPVLTKSLHQDNFKYSHIDANSWAEKNGVPVYFSSKKIEFKPATDYKSSDETNQPGTLVYLEHFIKKDFRRIFDLRMKNFIDLYKQKIISSSSRLEKLRVIIYFIQCCERLHPFDDGNTRTFSMLLLNYLLIQNNFPFVIRDNPNCIYALTIDELAYDVINGMKQTLDLASGIPPYNIELNKLCKKLTPKEQKHFDAIVLLETSNRKKIPRIETPEVETQLLSPYEAHQEIKLSEEAKESFDKKILDYIKKSGKGILNNLEAIDLVHVFDRLNNINAKTQWIEELHKANIFLDNDCNIHRILFSIHHSHRISFLIRHIESCFHLDEDSWKEIKTLFTSKEIAFIKKRLDFMKENNHEILSKQIVKRYSYHKIIFEMFDNNFQPKDSVYIFNRLVDRLTELPYLKHYNKIDLLKILCSSASVSNAEKIVLRKIIPPSSITTLCSSTFFKSACIVSGTVIGIGAALLYARPHLKL